MRSPARATAAVASLRSRRQLRATIVAFALVLVGGPTVALAADLTVDDRSLKTTGSWSKVSASSATEKTLLRSKKKGATASSKTDATAGGAVIFQVGAGRGTATISVGGKKKATVKTSAKKKSFKTVTFSGAGAVKVAVTKQDGGVYLDAIVLTGLGTNPVGGSTPNPDPTGPFGTPKPANELAPPAINPGPISQVDTSAAGAGGDGGDVLAAAVAPNGQSVAFWSPATNLVPGVADGHLHLYLKTLSTGAIRVLDAAQNGTISNDASSSSEVRGLAWKPDSSEILFTSSATNLGTASTVGLSGPFLYSKDVNDNSVGLLVEKASPDVAWSPNGAKIAFGSRGDFCRPADSPCTTTGVSDTKLYALDTSTFKITPISATSAGAQPQPNGGPNGSFHPVWSPDSTKVAFESDSPQLITGDNNVAADIFVKDVTTLAISRVSTTSSGGQANAYSEWPAFSPDGTKLAFDSKADNFVAGDNNSGEDVFIKDLGSGAISAVSALPSGEFKLFSHRVPKWSPDGSKIAFSSKSVDLIDGFVDSNTRDDIYVKTLATNRFQLISARADNVLGSGDSTLWGIFGSSGGWLPDGKSLVFLSRSTNLVPGDNNAFSESLFVKGGL